ncbi:MAG: RNA polymerase sigma factor [Chitinophagales bacterium]
MTTLDFSNHLQAYTPVLRPYAFNLVKDREKTNDLIQDTLYRAMANKSKFTEGTNMKAWLFTIMRNIFINDYRRSRKRLVVNDNSEQQHLIVNAGPVVGNQGERTFMAEEIDRALRQVSAEFTEPFMMYFNGFKYQEIAEKLSLPLGTVKSRIFFARKELQRRLRMAGVRLHDN